MPEVVKLFPCPVCGGNADLTNIYTTHDYFYVMCKKCGLTVEAKHSYCKGAAAEVWNSIPRALVWTTEPPKVPGQYWCSLWGISKWKQPFIIEIHDKPKKYESKARWAGPIPTPQEQTP